MPTPANEASENLAKFRAKIIAHPKLIDAFNSVLEFVNEPADVGVVSVIGPTGVGKSTLRIKLRSEILKQHHEAMIANPGLLPVVAVQAPAPDQGSFNWRDI